MVGTVVAKMGGDGVDWLALFEQEKVRFVILDRRSDRDLVALLRRRGGWTVDFEDEESMIFKWRSR
jgi:hypothetical protein